MHKIIFSFFFFFSVFSTAFSQNTALDFDGTGGDGGSTMSGQLIYPSSMVPLTNSFTVMGWVYVKAGHTQIFSWGSGTVNKYIQIKSSFDQKFQIFAAGGIINLTSTTVIGSAWHHVAVTNDAGSVTIYVDGVPEGTATADFSSINPTQSTLGTAFLNNLWQGSGKFDIDEFSIWDIALSEAQIGTYKDAPPVGSESGLVLAYDFNPSGVNPGGDNTSLTTIEDLTGNYQGTLYGFPLTGSTGNYITSTNTTLGTEALQQKYQISLYPNPVKNYVNLDFDNGLKINKINIYNSLGVLTKTFGDVNRKLNLSQLSTGLYFLKIDSDRGPLIYKLLKN